MEWFLLLMVVLLTVAVVVLFREVFSLNAKTATTCTIYLVKGTLKTTYVRELLAWDNSAIDDLRNDLYKLLDEGWRVDLDYTWECELSEKASLYSLIDEYCEARGKDLRTEVTYKRPKKYMSSL